MVAVFGMMMTGYAIHCMAIVTCSIITPDEVMSDKYVMAVSGSSGTTMAASFLITVTLMQL